MMRTHVRLPREQHQRLKELAQERGISLSKLIRQLLAEKLEDEAHAPDAPDRLRAALAVCGRHRDPAGLTDVAREHDAHLGEASGQ